MTLEETSAVMDVLTVAYPQFYKTQTDMEKLMAATLWAEMFADDDVRAVLAAVKALIASDTKGFPPVIGAVKDKLRLLTQPKEMTEQEAWALVSKAVRNGNYGAQAEFDKLPPVIQRIVGSPSQLREWAAMDSDTVQSVVASNFQRSYRARAAHEREVQALPTSVRQAIGGFSARFALEGGKQ